MDTFYSGNVHFQIEQGGGYWQTVNTAFSIAGQIVSVKLRDMKRSHPNNRVRAVTDSGQLIDII
jgi:hypothetical protein